MEDNHIQLELLATTEHRQAACFLMCRQVGEKGEHFVELFDEQRETLQRKVGRGHSSS